MTHPFAHPKLLTRKFPTRTDWHSISVLPQSSSIAESYNLSRSMSLALTVALPVQCSLWPPPGRLRSQRGLGTGNVCESVICEMECCVWFGRLKCCTQKRRCCTIKETSHVILNVLPNTWLQRFRLSYDASWYKPRTSDQMHLPKLYCWCLESPRWIILFLLWESPSRCDGYLTDESSPTLPGKLL